MVQHFLFLISILLRIFWDFNKILTICNFWLNFCDKFTDQ